MMVVNSYGKERIRPAMMGVPQTVVTMLLVTLEQDTPQTPASPSIQPTERVDVRGVLKVLKPSSRRVVDLGDDRSQAVAMLAGSAGCRPCPSS